jgi:hypothetical protein
MAGSVTINANTSMDSDLPDILLPTLAVTVADSNRTGYSTEVLPRKSSPIDIPYIQLVILNYESYKQLDFKYKHTIYVVSL